MSKTKAFFLAVGLLILYVIGQSVQPNDEPQVRHTASRNSAKDIRGLKAAGQAYSEYVQGE